MQNALTGTVPDERESRFLFPRVGVCEASVEVSGASIELRRFAWRDDVHEGSFAMARRFVELTDIRAEGGYHAEEPDWRSLGPMRFYPGHRRFYSRWFGDEQTSLLCALDVDHLTGLDLKIEDARLIECGDVHNDFLHGLLLRIRRELLAPGFASELIIEANCAAAAAELVQHFSGSAPRLRARGERLPENTLAVLADRIRAGDAPGSLQALADAEGISTRQYARLFRATAGQSIGRFYASQLVLRGKDLLADRSLLTKEIAYRCGFANTGSFARAFRRETGLSPAQYRRGFRETADRALAGRGDPIPGRKSR